jgi:hypothetical protein
MATSSMLSMAKVQEMHEPSNRPVLRRIARKFESVSLAQRIRYSILHSTTQGEVPANLIHSEGRHIHACLVILGRNINMTGRI